MNIDKDYQRFCKYEDQFDLPEGQFGQLMHGISTYCLDGVIPKFDTQLEIVFNLIKDILNRDYMEWEETRKARWAAEKKNKNHKQAVQVENWGCIK